VAASAAAQGGLVKVLGGKRRLRPLLPGGTRYVSPRSLLPLEPLADESPSTIDVPAAALDATAAAAPAIRLQDAAAVEGYDPLVLWAPPEDVSLDSFPAAAAWQPVVVEPLIGKFLRSHQREGLSFLFQCVHGMRPYAGHGCILADDMGLGKTLQSIALLYTVLRQGVPPQGMELWRRARLRELRRRQAERTERKIASQSTPQAGGVEDGEGVGAGGEAEEDDQEAEAAEAATGAVDISSLATAQTPTARRALVVCPTSLVSNWAKEIEKWLGLANCNPLPVTDSSKAGELITQFLSPRCPHPVLIISYETFRMHAKTFHARPDSCDLLICDEAHRLKNDRTLTTQALNGLACRRRVLLSGTPMQNDLDEFWSMVDFTNPGVLGDAAAFRRVYAGPILAGREPWASDRVRTEGEEASKRLSAVVNQFILRRTNSLLSQHLPPKLLQVVCVKLAPLQRALYDHFLSSKELQHIMSGRQSGVLASITALRKLVNHPRLVWEAMKQKAYAERMGQRVSTARDEAAGFEECEQYFPPGYSGRGSNTEMSGKFELVSRMLRQLRTTTQDRIVIVSCYTQTLDIFQQLCKENAWPFLRLDGSIATGKRQKLVDQFNDFKQDQFVFLLSSKA
jgi:SNF2 family DNA or RNA helicase